MHNVMGYKKNMRLLQVTMLKQTGNIEINVD